MGKGKRSNEGQYVNLSYAQLQSKSWRSLSGAAVKVWCELHTRFNGGNNGSLTLSMAEAAEILGMGKATAQRAFRELEEHGFIVLVKKGNWYYRQAHEWRLTTKPMQGDKGKTPPTLDWRSWQPPKKQKRGSIMEPSSYNLVPFQNPQAGSGSKPEPVRRKSGPPFGSEMEH
jgi:hypothetical protein